MSADAPEQRDEHEIKAALERLAARDDKVGEFVRMLQDDSAEEDSGVNHS